MTRAGGIGGLGMALVGLALAAALAVFVRTAWRDAALAHGDGLQEQLEQLRVGNARWDTGVLRVRIGLDRDYDALSAVLQDVSRLELGLDALPREADREEADVTLREALEHLHALLAEKAALVERFKSANSVLRNSATFLPVSGVDVHAALPLPMPRASDQAVAAAVDRVALALMTQLATGQDPAGVEAQLPGTDLSALEAAMRRRGPDVVSQRVETFVAHARTLMRERARADVLLRQIADVAVDAAVDRADRALDERARRRSDAAARDRAWLLGFTAALCVLLVAAALRLLRGRVLVERMNATLEERVAERTQALCSAQAALRRRETLQAAILDSVRDEIAVLDRDGVIVALNAPWRHLAARRPDQVDRWGASLAVGDDLLASLDAHETVGDGALAAARDGIREVLGGRRASMELDYRCDGAGVGAPAPCWIQMNVTPLATDEGGAVVTQVDVTARRLSADALRASEAFLAQTGRVGGVGGWQLDLRDGALQWTAETARLLEVDPACVPTVSEFVALCDPAARSTLEAAIASTAVTRRGFDLELPMVSGQGRALWTRIVAAPDLVDGEPVRLLGALQDITQRREMQAAALRHTALLQAILEGLPCGLVVADAGGRVMVANDRYADLLGLPRALLAPGQSQLREAMRFLAERGEYGPCDVEDKVSEAMARALHPDPQAYERVRANGQVLEVRSAPMSGGGVVATFTDVTARRHAEDGERRSTQLLRSAIEAIDEAFVLFDPLDRLVYCNEKYQALFGDAASAVVPGASFRDIKRAALRRGLYGASAREVEGWLDELEAAHRLGDGAHVHRLADGRILRSLDRRMADGHIVGFRVDITELVRATEAAQAALTAKGRFLANMSHEIRTPMNAVLGMLALLRRSDLTRRQADHAMRAESAARGLLGILDEILDFSKLESGQMTLEHAPFELEGLLRQLSVIVSATAGSRPLDLRFEIDATLPAWWVGDGLRLQQVLINLAGNAVKFTERGEVVVSMATRHRSPGRVGVEIAVRDTGIGIAPEHQARIFAGFTQAEASTTRRFGGTGLGLSISQQLVAAMGGQLRVDSRAGAGSRFHFVLDLPVLEDGPALAAAPGAATPEGSPEGPPAPVHVLLVSDSAARRQGVLAVRPADWQITEIDLDAIASRGCGPSSGPDAVDLVCVACADPAALVARLDDRSVVAVAPAEGLACARAGLVHLVPPFTRAMLAEAGAAALGRASADATSPGGSRAARLAGLRILLAEDNPANQLVARELLEEEGASVRVVVDGAQAVGALAPGDAGPAPFDVVLMDLQMPVLDGLAAARRIRSGEGPAAGIPIIAMTANASAEDRAQCLAAGMDDHVGKPFDLEQLVRALLKRVGRAGGDEPSVVPPRGVVSPPDVVSRAVRAQAGGAGVDIDDVVTRLDGHLRLYRALLSQFLAGLDGAAARLREATPHDTSAAVHLLHTQRGLAATVGQAALAAALARSEAILSAGDADAAACAQALASAGQALAAARPGLAALAEALAQEQSVEEARRGDGPLAARSDELVAVLRTLLVQLDAADLAAFDTVQALQARGGPGVEAWLRGVAQHVDQLDFEAAAAQVRAWWPVACDDGPESRCNSKHP